MYGVLVFFIGNCVYDVLVIFFVNQVNDPVFSQTAKFMLCASILCLLFLQLLASVIPQFLPKLIDEVSLMSICFHTGDIFAMNSSERVFQKKNELFFFVVSENKICRFSVFFCSPMQPAFLAPC